MTCMMLYDHLLPSKACAISLTCESIDGEERYAQGEYVPTPSKHNEKKITIDMGVTNVLRARDTRVIAKVTT